MEDGAGLINRAALSAIVTVCVGGGGGGYACDISTVVLVVFQCYCMYS